MINMAILMLSYGIGTISPAYLLVRLLTGKDIRQYGSGNAGTTNVMRLLGAKAAVLVLFLDLLKGVAAVWIGRKFGGEAIASMAGLAAVIGHNWPITMKFKGGKGVATTMGVGIMTNPFFAAICIVLSILIIALTKYVSLASITAVPIWTILVWVTGEPSQHIFLGLALSILVLFRHQTNIARIFKGTENRFSIRDKMKKEECSK